MPANESERTPTPRRNEEHFTETPWTLVLRAGWGSASKEGAAALEWLCERYWYPLYAFARRSGLGPHDAEDATQGFFAYLLESSALAKANPGRGRFRNFLLTAFNNFRGQQREQLKAWKRGGRHSHVSLDSLTAEERYLHEPVDGQDPSRLFEAAWATTTIQAGLERLRLEYSRLGKSGLFEALLPHLTGDPGSYAELGLRIGQSPGAARVTVHRIRARFSAAVRAEVAATVDGESEANDELRHLKSVLTRS
jgi:DNA-directed RNA polymerase specialized sigma24 family protein